MKERMKKLILVLAVILAVFLGIRDGLRYEIKPAKPQVDEEILDSAGEVMENTFRWHFRFKYPELFVWDALFNEQGPGVGETSNG